MNGYLVRGHMKFCETPQEEEYTQLEKYVDYVKNTQDYKNKNMQDFDISKHYDKADNGHGVTLYDLSKAMFEITAVATKLGYTHKDLMQLSQYKS
jgi:hypothetical protein